MEIGSAFFKINIYTSEPLLNIFFMKKLISSMLALFLTFGAFSQTEKGSKLFGVSFGSLSYTSSDSKTTYSNTATEYMSDGSSFSVSLNPNMAWFVKDNLAVGAGLSLSLYTSKSESSNTSSSTVTESKYNSPSVYIGPFARYYFGEGTTGKPFAQVNFQYGISGGKSESDNGSNSSETQTHPKYDWNTGLQVGYEHFLSPYLGCYASVGINYGQSKTDYEYKPSTGTGYDYSSEYNRLYFPINFGLQIHFPAKK